MKTKNLLVVALLALALVDQAAKAQFVKIDDFTNDTPAQYGTMANLASDGPTAGTWQLNGTGSMVLTNSPTPGAGMAGSGMAISATTNAAASTALQGVAYIALPTAIPTSSSIATVFFQFDMGPTVAANNINFDIAGAVAGSGGGSQNQIEINANVPNRTGLCLGNASAAWRGMSADGVNQWLPAANTVYDMWVIIDNNARTFYVYVQDANTNGANDLPNQTQMLISTIGSPGSGGFPVGTIYNTNALGFRSGTVQALTLFAFGTGGTGDGNQYLYSVYEDANEFDLTNPVTGAAPISLSPPVITAQPLPAELYAGASVTFGVGAAGGGLSYQWETNGVAIGNGGNVSGATSPNLSINNITAAYALTYSCMVDNANTGAYNTTNSAGVSLSVVTPNGAYETANAAADPLHFYAFDDTGNPNPGPEVAYDYEGGDSGIYGYNTLNASYPIYGPRPSDGLPGFSSANYAAAFNTYEEPDHVTINSPWNLNTNTVTFMAWVYPQGGQDSSAAIVLNRGSGNDVGGLTMTVNGSDLGYTWNNDANTANWDSGIAPPAFQWSLVALVVTPTNASISVMNTSGLTTSTHIYPHGNEPFSGTTMIGDDPGSVANGIKTYTGSIDEVSVLNYALSRTQLQNLFTNASGAITFPPTNTVSLVTAEPIYPMQTVQFASVIEGSEPITYTWQVNGKNLTDGANAVGLISGSATPFLTISNLAPADANQTYNLTLVQSGPAGSYTSSVPAQLYVYQPELPTTITTLGMEASGSDWNTATNWSDDNPASTSAYLEPGSTYQIVPGTLERSPTSTNASFPGVVMQVLGNGVLLDGGLSSFATNDTTTGELRLKQSGSTSATNYGTTYTDGGTVNFQDLQLRGGQVDNGTSSKVTLTGEVDVFSNSAIYADSAANGSIRSIQLSATLTGTGTLTYGYLSTPTVNNDLIVAGTNNTFSGAWNIVGGTLFGQATNSLGTNTITISTNSALETAYNLYSPKANLILGGKMYLYTSNTFNSVLVSGVSLTNGTYSSAQLNGLFPANFPTTWPVQLGSSTGTNTGVGYLTVLTTLTPQITQQPTNLSLYPGQTAQFAAVTFGALASQWWFTNNSNVGTRLVDSSNLTESTNSVLTIAHVGSTNAGTYTLFITNTAGATSSISATLTILTPSPQTTITMSVAEGPGQDWNTGTNWSDNNPASLSVYSEPGSTYVIEPPNGVLRTPAGAASAAFPGTKLIVGNVSGSTAELLLEHAAGGGTVAFPDLQLQGTMDNGADGLATVTGEMDISNSVTIFTDTNLPPGFVVNFDVSGGLSTTNYNGLGAYADVSTNIYWNPSPSGTANGTTTAPATDSDGVTPSAITLSQNVDAQGTGDGYGSFDNTPGTTTNTPPALEDNYLWDANSGLPNPIYTVITNTLNNVPAGTYDLYLYGNNGGNTAGGFEGSDKQNDWGTLFTVTTDFGVSSVLGTSNSPATYTQNKFILGLDYVVFSNLVVGASGNSGAITFSYGANTNLAILGGNAYAAFNGLQLVKVEGVGNGPRPIAVNSLLTGNGTVSYAAGDKSFISDLDIGGAGNPFYGQWNVVQGALLGGAAGSLGTNSITVGANGALETLYNVNDPSAGLVLNGKMFLHTTDTFYTLTVNGAVVNAGTYMWSQLNSAYPANFPASWPMQTNSTVNTASGSITVLSPAGSSSTTTLVVQPSGGNFQLTWTNGGTLQSTTNLLSPWVNVPGASSGYIVVPTNMPGQFFRVHP